MKSIEFDAKFGDELKKIKLVANDYSGGRYQILIANYFEGEISYSNGEWRVHLNDRSILTADDITIIGDIIDSEKAGG